MWQLSDATSCQLIYLINTVQQLTAHIRSRVADGSEKQ